MKKLLLILMAFTMAYSVNAQVETPQPSPFTKIEQKVGLTDVTLEYSRPNMRDRTIFGDLVPYDKLWRTGANANTKITFSDDVVINGTTLKAGEYAIFAKPGKTSWEVIFYSDASNWGTPRNWDDTKVAVKTTAKVYEMPMKIETFTIGFDDLSNSSAVIGMIWENVYVGVKFEVPTDEAVVASIKKAMNGPGANDYFSAAVYYLQEGKDIAKAKKWIDKAVDMTKDKPRFWYLRQQSLIHAKAGDKAGAVKAAKASLAGAEKAGNADYVKMNKESLAEWGAM
ncbi:DUF2911 domain-containing protein [Jejuia spongiicola]|uniref:DUF2911 domain-containing protein n=1 Tax=Jejuia spongiicola TaxID=2942207 RepID=A0ABT0QGJ0_9FLAO|nr:DUF2911 domain-containing protein [Jejuia spongiicola]MCL6296098.1 DUF2911 domain-containing protein [Jejuia spongiicola]